MTPGKVTHLWPAIVGVGIGVAVAIAIGGHIDADPDSDTDSDAELLWSEFCFRNGNELLN